VPAPAGPGGPQLGAEVLPGRLPALERGTQGGAVLHLGDELEVALLDAVGRGDVVDEEVVDAVAVEVAGVRAHALERVVAEHLGLGDDDAAVSGHPADLYLARGGGVVPRVVGA